MKRNLIVIILAICLIFNSYAGASGLLPSLVDTIGKPMPSLGEALGRYPDDEISISDISNTEVFYSITEEDFNTFSVYLNEHGAILSDYHTAGSAFFATVEVDGKIISFSYDIQSLEARVTYPKGTYDEWLDYAKTQFESAVQLLDMGKTDEGMSVLFSIPGHSGYKPAVEYIAAHPELAEVVAAREAKLALYRNVGGYVTFGSYEQDNNTANGQEPIEWLVLDYDAVNNRALLISRYGLDAKPYSEKGIDITWEKCTLRTWLNGEFMNNAFSKTEQGAILTTAVDNSKNQGYSKWSTSGGNNTQDRIFLLSYAEANKYLSVTYDDSNNMKSRVSPTAYAIKQGALTSDSHKTADGAAAGWWWLRSPGINQYSAAYVSYDGALSLDYVNSDSGCVRPALWINLESDIF